MQDFLERLDAHLAALATSRAAERAARQAGRRTRPRRRPALLAGVGTASALAAGFALTGTSTAQLPILVTPATDARHVEATAVAARRAGVDFSAGHAFDTPHGPGYVLENGRDGTLCVATPDPAAPGTYAASCAPIGDVEQRGLPNEVAGDRNRDPKAVSLVTFVLPEGARDVRLSTRGAAPAPAPVESGIAVLDLARDATLSWTVNGRRRQRAFAGPFVTESARVTCPDGSTGTMPLAALAGAPAEQQAARRKACR